MRTDGGPTLTFLGGVGTVTGSKYLVRTEDGIEVLVDCGLFQGRKELRLRNWAPFDPPPADIDAVVLTHAHIDHCGHLPRLVNEGFAGRVHCTRGTAQLAGIVLPDSGHLHEEEAAYANRQGFSKHRPALPLYTEDDARTSLSRFVACEFDEPVTVAPGVEVTWRRAGHILGAASIHMHLTGSGRRLVFSGDLGRDDHPLLLPPDPVGEADIVVCETTYGDQEHEPEYSDESDRLETGVVQEGGVPAGGVQDLLAEAVNDAARRGGVVVIPAFAVDRTEMLLYHLDVLVRSGAIPDLPVFVDSPMASAALELYRDEAHAGSPEIRPEFHGRPLFDSLNLTETRTVEDSKQLNSRRGPFVVVSASGMATGGRVLHHLAARLGDDRNTVLLVGFQAPGTRGDRLASGAPTVKLLGSHRPVAAQVRSLALSAHADRAELTSWLCTATDRLETVYLTHGEPAASAAFSDHLEAVWSVPSVIPAPAQQVNLGAR